MLGGFSISIRNKIKSIIVLEGRTIEDVVKARSEKYGRSASVSSFTAKLSRGTLRYTEALEVADVLGYEIVWQKRRERQ